MSTLGSYYNTLVDNHTDTGSQSLLQQPQEQPPQHKQEQPQQSVCKQGGGGGVVRDNGFMLKFREREADDIFPSGETTTQGATLAPSEVALHDNEADAQLTVQSIIPGRERAVAVTYSTQQSTVNDLLRACGAPANAQLLIVTPDRGGVRSATMNELLRTCALEGSQRQLYIVQ